MTIIRPNRNQRWLNVLIGLLGTSLVLVLFLGLVVYIDTVSLQHDVTDQDERLGVMNLSNIDARSRYYSVVDSENLELLARTRGLVKDNNPRYLKFEESKWRFASHF